VKRYNPSLVFPGNEKVKKEKEQPVIYQKMIAARTKR
jgi:hypothetical protein